MWFLLVCLPQLWPCSRVWLSGLSSSSGPERAGGCPEALTSGLGDDSVIAGMPRIWSHLKFIFACPLSPAGSPIKMC